MFYQLKSVLSAAKRAGIELNSREVKHTSFDGTVWVENKYSYKAKDGCFFELLLQHGEVSLMVEDFNCGKDSNPYNFDCYRHFHSSIKSFIGAILEADSVKIAA